MHTSIQPPRHATTSTSVEAGRHAHRFFGLLVSLCFAGVAATLLYFPSATSGQAMAGTIAGGGIAVGIMLGWIPWSHVAPLWLDTYCIGLAALVAALVLHSGGATSPFAPLFFVVSACTALSSRRGSASFIATLIALLHILPLGYSSTAQAFMVSALFSLPVHLAIAMIGSVAGTQRTEQRYAPVVEEHTVSTSPQAVRDHLTGLHTGAALARHLQETQRLPSATKAFSMVLIGVDHWDVLCDKHGRRSGDDIIRQVAVILQNHSRSSDVAARFDDRTFLIIFPGASAEIAMKLSERLRAVLEQHRFWTPDSPTRLAISLSLGVAACPEDGSTSDELAQKATQRMHLLQQAHKAPAGAQH
jgi:diguanylate cyclase (GGDEF)-like protein